LWFRGICNAERRQLQRQHLEPAGWSYTVQARYGGDTNFGSSLSAPVAVTVTPEASTITITPQVINLTTCTITNGNTFTYGQLIWVQVTVAGVSGQGVPTGSVNITVDGNSYATETLDPQGNGYLVAGNVGTASNSCLYDYTFAQSRCSLVNAHHQRVVLGRRELQRNDGRHSGERHRDSNRNDADTGGGATLITSATATRLAVTFQPSPR